MKDKNMAVLGIGTAQALGFCFLLLSVFYRQLTILVISTLIESVYQQQKAFENFIDKQRWKLYNLNVL
jgi:hypothetical protein